jgi:hypothetical protein
MSGQENRLEGVIDGALQLLDHQLLDSEGRMLGKVDDVELTQTDEGLTVTALLTGPAALLRRLGGRLGNEAATKWEQLRPSEPHRGRPWRVGLDLVERLDSAVHLTTGRDDVLVRDRETFRLGTLTGMSVQGPDRRTTRVLDARFEPATPGGPPVLRALVVGRGHPGSLLGYDRHPGQGPAAVRLVVGWLHRHTGVVGVEDVDILWNRREVVLRREPDTSPEALRR